jgi:hypothetical protein
MRGAGQRIFTAFTKHLPPKILLEKAISKLNYGIDLSHLKRSKFVPK